MRRQLALLLVLAAVPVLSFGDSAHAVIVRASYARPPVVAAFAMPATSDSFTVPVTTFTASGGTRYLITESATPPAANDPGWSASVPNSFTFTGSTGSKTAYAWAKNVVGTVSTSRSATVTVTILAIQFAAEGTNIAKAIGLRAMLRARHDFPAGFGHGAFTGEVSPGYYGASDNPYNWLYLTDWYFMARAFPGLFTVAQVRAVVDAFAASIGQDPLSRNLANVAQYISGGTSTVGGESVVPGKFGFRPGSGGYYPAFGNNYEFAQMIVLAHDRGDNQLSAGAFNTYLAQAEAALDSIPRQNGLLYVPDAAANWSSGWNWEDGVKVSGRLMLASVEYARSYQELARIATSLGRTSDATRLTGKASTIIAAIASLRDGANGLYHPSDGPEATIHGIPHSAIMVAFGLVAGADQTQTINTLKTKYDSSLLANGGITRRGSVRALDSGQFYPNALGAQGESMNGGYRTGSILTRWLALALYQGGYVSAAQDLVQRSSVELLRQKRVEEQNSNNWQNWGPPWEVESNTVAAPYGTINAKLYGLSAGHLENTTDSKAAYVDIVLSAGNGYSSEAAFPYGNQVSRVEILGTQPATATITIDAAAELASATDPWPEPAPSYGAYDATLGVIVLANETNKAATAITPAKIHGGKVRARVTSGAGAGTITVRLHQTCTPSLVAPSESYSDDFATDRLTTDYSSIAGLWAVTGGTLQGSAAAGVDERLVTVASYAAELGVQAVLTSPDWYAVEPGLLARCSADAGTCVLATVYNLSGNTEGRAQLYERVSGGAYVSLGVATGLPAWVAGTSHTVRVAFSPVTPGKVTMFVDGVARVAATTSVTTSGRAGFRTARASGGTAQYDDFKVLAQPGSIPPGYVLEWGGASGAVLGDDIYDAGGTVNLRDGTGAVVSSRAAPVRIAW